MIPQTPRRASAGQRTADGGGRQSPPAVCRPPAGARLMMPGESHTAAQSFSSSAPRVRHRRSADSASTQICGLRPTSRATGAGITPCRHHGRRVRGRWRGGCVTGRRRPVDRDDLDSEACEFTTDRHLVALPGELYCGPPESRRGEGRPAWLPAAICSANVLVRGVLALTEGSAFCVERRRSW